MTTNEMIALRKALGLTQAEMGARVGLSLRAYQDIETGTAKLRALHVAAVERVALAMAVERGDPMLAPLGVRQEALGLARLLGG